MNQETKKILTSFSSIETIEDLHSALNKAKNKLYGNRSRKDLRLKSLHYYGNSYIKKKKYKTFTIKKRTGGDRIIKAPHKGLKTIQRSLAFLLSEIFSPSRIAYGFISGKSIIDNAKVHVNRNYVFNIDIKEFFPSIEFGRIKAVMMLPPFNCNKEVAFGIASICCTEMEVDRQVDGNQIIATKSVLPQGAPTSPVLTNIICQRLDRKLIGVAKRFGIKVSRYADDITFSSDHNVYQQDSEFRQELSKIMTSQGFLINEKKVRLQNNKQRQEVTGLIVNEKINLHRSYIKTLRTILHNWQKSGYEYAEKVLSQNYCMINTNKKSIPKLRNFVEGKLLYMKMVQGESHPTYQKLQNKFLYLVNQEILPQNSNYTKIKDVFSKENLTLDDILEKVVTEGLNKGMELYEQYQKQRG